MRFVVPLMVVGLSMSPAMADRVFWKATGKVTDVVGAGFQALVAADEEVDVEFSYDDLGIGIAKTGIAPFFQTFDFREDIELEMKITIGGLSWVGFVASGPVGTALTFEVTDVQTSLGFAEKISPLISSDFGDVFSMFPGASATGVNELQVTLEDGQAPHGSVFGPASEPVTDPPAKIGISSVFFTPCEFTAGSGEIRAGAETISYVIDLNTLRVGDGTPPPAPTNFAVSIEWLGEQVKLDWEATVDKCYRIQWSSDLQNWNDLTGVVAFSADESYSFVPLEMPGAQYYRIVQTD